MKKLVLILSAMYLAANIFAAEKKLKIVVSIMPLYNITKAIVGDTADITVMVPPGASVHTFEPKPSQVKDLANADIFIEIGAGLEFWDEKMLKAAGNKKLKIIRCTDGVKLMQEQGAEKEEHPEAGNPHIWLDPIIVKDIATKIYGAIAVPEYKEDPFYTKYAVFDMQMDSLDKYIRAEVSKFRIKNVVSFHPAWAYFEKRYGLKEVGVIEATPGKEPTPKELENIISQIKKYNIKTIFAEPQLPRKAADIIAKEAGVSVLILDPLGNTGETYVDFMKKNVDAMKEAMK
jgi:zinc transport system substrate-binding protein